MTHSNKYSYSFFRCDNCGCDGDPSSSCWCGSPYFVQVTGFDHAKAKSDNNLVSSVTDTTGTLHTLKDGSTYYQSNSGW